MTVEKRNNTEVDFDPFSGDIIEKIVPAIESQKEIFASCVLGGDDANLAYNLSLSLTFKGRLNENALRKAINELHQRHESLRATFTEDGSQMIIYESKAPHLHYQNLEAYDKPAQQNILEEYHSRNARSPFDLFNGPLTRTALFCLGSEEHLLTVTAHHIICDGWSLGILLEDLSRLYNAEYSGVMLPSTPLLFSDYVIQCARYERSANYDNVLHYWKRQYEDDVPVFEIPPDFPRPARRTYKANREDFVMSVETAEKIKKVGARYGCSFVNTLLSVFEVLLYKYSGSADIIVALPTAGQASNEMYDLIGHCVNLLPLRSRPNTTLSFADYLVERKSKMLEDYDHQQFTFGTFLQKIKIERDPSRIPLVPVAFNIDIGMDGQVSFENLDYTINNNKRASETFELFLNVTNCKEGYEFQWSYNTQLYKSSTIQGLMASFNYLIEQIVVEPEVKIGTLRINQNRGAFDRLLQQYGGDILNMTVVELFEKSVKSFPGNIAVRFGDHALTYNELDLESNRLANYLLFKGIHKNDRVAIVLGRGVNIIVSILAVLKCGASYIPVDPHYPKDRVAFMIDDADAQLIITSLAHVSLFDNERVNTIVLDEVQRELERCAVNSPAIQFGPETIAYILYTSGSTGKPKGAMVTHRNLVHFLKGMQAAFQITSESKFLSVSSISFDASCFDNYLCLVNGAELVLTSNEIIKDGQLLLNEIERRQISIILATPITFKLMLAADWNKKIPVTLLSAGEVLLPALAKELIPRCKALYNVYGPTETTVICTLTRVLNDSRITIGAAIADTPIYILDDQMNPVAEGEIGEIFIGGDGVSNGYWKREELTRQKFIADPFAARADARMYRSGDLGRRKKNGEIKYEGRVDNQVKIRGFRIELGEIEYHLSRLTHIRDVATAVHEDQHGEKNIVAYIISDLEEGKDESTFKKDIIVNWGNQLRNNLPYFMIPSFWVRVKQFPLSPNGKVDVKKLAPPEMYRKQDGEHVSNQTPERARLSDHEQLIKEIWESELGLTDLSVDDNFFELGGHSMIAVKVMNRIGKQTHTKLPIASLFEYPTIASLSKLLDKTAHFKYRALIPIKKTGSKPPIYLVHGGSLNILLYKNLEPFLSEDQPLYGIQALGLDGDLSHLDTMESIVERYLEEVLEQNPNGPYILIGYSYGGIVVFEMARQLMAMGKEIRMLGIMDTNVSDRAHSEENPGRLGRFLGRQVKKAIFFGGNLTHSPGEVIKYQWNVLRRKLDKNFEEAEDEQIYDYDKPVIEAYNNAYYNYDLKPLDVKVHLFRVKERTYFVDDRTYLGWMKYAKKGVAVYDVTGDHKTFILPPHNEHLIKKIEKIISAI